MATGRTTNKWIRFYCDGYDLSGYGRTVGPLTWEFDSADLTAQMGDAIKGELPTGVNISPGVFNGSMQSTTDSGVEVSVIQAAGTGRDIMIPIGIRAEPAAGDQVWVSKSTNNAFQVAEAGGAMTINATFNMWDGSDLSSFAVPWGILAHARGSESDVNVADGYDTGYVSTPGGLMAYQVFSGNWVGNLKAQSIDTIHGTYADITGATVALGGLAPAGGIISIATSVTVLQFVRWQLTYTSGTTTNFALAWIPSAAAGSVRA